MQNYRFLLVVYLLRVFVLHYCHVYEFEVVIMCGLSLCVNSEVGGRTLYRLLVRDAGGDTEGVLLNETVPPWVVDIVVEKNLPKFIKIPFYLLPHATSGVKSLKK